MKDAGLADLAYDARPPSGDWPTLREMIDDNQRVVFLAENHAGAAPWYRLAYEQITEETPTLLQGRPAHDAGRAAGELQAQPRPGGRAALPAQPLDHDRPACRGPPTPRR